jgi:hypothetical protein
MFVEFPCSRTLPLQGTRGERTLRRTEPWGRYALSRLAPGFQAYRPNRCEFCCPALCKMVWDLGAQGESQGDKGDSLRVGCCARGQWSHSLSTRQALMSAPSVFAHSRGLHLAVPRRACALRKILREAGGQLSTVPVVSSPALRANIRSRLAEKQRAKVQKGPDGSGPAANRLSR